MYFWRNLKILLVSFLGSSIIKINESLREYILNRNSTHILSGEGRKLMNNLVNDNLYETRNNLVQEITLLSAAQFNRKLDMNMWSIAQVCHHLVLVEEASIKAIVWGLKEIDRTQKERKDIYLILLDRTKKLKASKIVEC